MRKLVFGMAHATRWLGLALLLSAASVASNNALHADDPPPPPGSGEGSFFCVDCVHPKCSLDTGGGLCWCAILACRKDNGPPAICYCP